MKLHVSRGVDGDVMKTVTPREVEELWNPPASRRLA